MNWERIRLPAWGTFAKIDAVYWMVVNAFAISITTFVGQNYGAGKVKRMRKSDGVCLGWPMRALSL